MEQDILFAGELATSVLTRSADGTFGVVPNAVKQIASGLASVVDPARFEATLLEVVRFACLLEAEHGATVAAGTLLRGAELAASRLVAFGREPASLVAARDAERARWRRASGGEPVERRAAPTNRARGVQLSALTPHRAVRV